MFNHKHLHYFWVVAHEGSISRAARRLNIAPQTISSQLRVLEADLGRILFAQAGRGLELTEAGKSALHYADQIFQLSEALQRALNEAEDGHVVRLRVGITDGIPKMLAFRALQRLHDAIPTLHLVCDEGEHDTLLADLALHRLDAVLSDRPSLTHPGLKLFSRLLCEMEMGWFARDARAPSWQISFPNSLTKAPILLPTTHHQIRTAIDRWLQIHHIHPDIVGEFEDNALLTTFAASGMGLFPAPLALRKTIHMQLGADLIGSMDGVKENIYLISNVRKIVHPAVEFLTKISLTEEN